MGISIKKGKYCQKVKGLHEKKTAAKMLLGFSLKALLTDAFNIYMFTY